MQVKLMEGLFSSSLCEVQVAENGLLLTASEGKELCIPYTQLRHIDISGKQDRRKRLRIETDAAVYEGQFPTDEDAAVFLDRLRQLKGCYVDIRLDLDPARG